MDRKLVEWLDPEGSGQEFNVQMKTGDKWHKDLGVFVGSSAAYYLC